jgi:hypothetical protein
MLSSLITLLCVAPICLGTVVVGGSMAMNQIAGVSPQRKPRA